MPHAFTLAPKEGLEPPTSALTVQRYRLLELLRNAFNAYDNCLSSFQLHPSTFLL